MAVRITIVMVLNNPIIEPIFIRRESSMTGTRVKSKNNLNSIFNYGAYRKKLQYEGSYYLTTSKVFDRLMSNEQGLRHLILKEGA
jgi:hypothetical protein